MQVDSEYTWSITKHCNNSIVNHFGNTVGIFSLFGKKGSRKEDHSSEKSSDKKTRSKSANTVITGFHESEIFTNSIIAQRHIARATERASEGKKPLQTFLVPPGYRAIDISELF